ncbi:nicotinamide riboside kinase [Flavobacterium arsenatis]|uniref:Nicotinamide riboside kinase n=1 Tax=Flavobacterium arsenatis TaxID=1484332 RepID=A0ABU1TSV5_9FLAO|nr:DUF4301 family protein [Flavobacterium arsenatis]MDR6968916.1 nicotinamide riboside kinase [Flavobacterium arsenatis]
MFGPESTGKTTLAKQLADHFQTVWAPEFARDYLQEKWNISQKVCEPEDLLPIAIGQVKLENDSLQKANKYLFCDTNLMVTKVFSELYYNFCDPILEKAATKHKYDLFFLTDIDVPWTKDDLRDKPSDREKTFETFKKTLIENKKPFVVISGTPEERFNKGLKILSDLEKAKNIGLSSSDFVKIYEYGVNPDTILKHLAIFKKGMPKTILDRAAVIGDGIAKLSETDFKLFESLFDSEKDKLKLKKFVPASGAASRMFKFLSEFLNDFKVNEESINAYINRTKDNALTVFLAGLEKYPFYEEIDDALKRNYSNYHYWNKDLKDYYFIKTLLSPKYLNFAGKPKGILPFHKYDDGYITTPVEEHLKECAFYSSSNNTAFLHFTISEEHQIDFEKIIGEVKEKIERQSGIKITIKFSYQNKATDTIAVDVNNEPFRDQNGELVFRPGGHGALIDNLNNLDADIVFIKNIDNVIQNHIEEIALYKKALAGVLIALQQQIFSYSNKLDSDTITEDDIEEIVSFVKNKLNNGIVSDFEKYTLGNKISYIKEILNRPIRVCGMVKNEGEPGGGPFWIKHNNGHVSLQIVESSQVDLNNAEQLAISKTATHFNPVDLICGIKNYKGEKFDLTQFVDHNSGFIVEKNKDGRALKAYELPGLWNGAMAKWITIFVQVPLITFNPVKTVNDLLKPAHQPQ